MTRRPSSSSVRFQGRIGWIVAALGLAAAAVAAATHPRDARFAIGQNWSPFVLVEGLLLIGLVANGDGLFIYAGQCLARTLRNGACLFLGGAALIAVVTALLNLDTSVAFLTPVFGYTARSRGGDDAPLVYSCLLLSNAGSLFLPGSNLTNLIVLGQLHLSGRQFLGHMWPAGLAALVVTAAAIAFIERRALRLPAAPTCRSPTRQPSGWDCSPSSLPPPSSCWWRRRRYPSPRSVSRPWACA